MGLLAVRRATLLALATLLGLAIESTAHARGIIFITRGNTVKHLGSVAEPMKADVREGTGGIDDLEVGYLHERFGVFWVDLWTWGGKYVLYNDDRDDVWEIEEPQAAELLGVTSGKVGKPFFYTVPPGLVVLGILGAVWAIRSRQQSRIAAAQRAELEEAANDPRYQRALATLIEHFQKRDADAVAAADADASDAATSQPADGATAAAADQAAFDRAVQSLVAQGIAQEDADRRLWMLLAASRSNA